MAANRHTGVRRIHADIRELHHCPSDQYTAAPVDDNLFDWHFTVRGPPGTDFEGGIYHGRMLLPPDYPFKPPSIMFLTANGRFSVGAKICLSISAHHPEHWQPAWGVRLILEALVSFFPTEAGGAIGALDWSPAERRRLAKESQSWCCPKCGLAAATLPEIQASDSENKHAASHKSSEYAAQFSELHIHGLKSTSSAENVKEEKVVNVPAGDEGAVSNAESSTVEEQTVEATTSTDATSTATISVPTHTSTVSTHSTTGAKWITEDDVLQVLAYAIFAGMIAILVKKALRIFGVDLEL